jgi:hypothetical protein
MILFVERRLLNTKSLIIKNLIMRNLSLTAFAGFLLLWGISNYLNRNNGPVANVKPPENSKAPVKGTLLSRSNLKSLDKIGEVINEKNVQLDVATKEKIVSAKNDYNMKLDLKSQEKILIQSFNDPHSTIQDIKDIQNKIVQEKNKLKIEVNNTEKWEPGFIYYLMINENYSLTDINSIQSLTENGFNAEELNYISEAMRTKDFYNKISEYKGQADPSRKIASVTKNMKDEYNDNAAAETQSAEDKIIEMNYSQQHN